MANTPFKMNGFSGFGNSPMTKKKETLDLGYINKSRPNTKNRWRREL